MKILIEPSLNRVETSRARSGSGRAEAVVETRVVALFPQQLLLLVFADFRLRQEVFELKQEQTLLRSLTLEQTLSEAMKQGSLQLN